MKNAHPDSIPNTRPTEKPPLFSALWIAALLALAALVVAPKASAQFFPSVVSMTNAIPATTTNSFTTALIDASQTEEFGLQVAGRLTGAGTSAVSYVVQNSVDNANWVDVFSFTLTAAGTNTVTFRTNVICQAIPFYRISTVGNANATAWTNAIATTGFKRSVAKYRAW